MIYNTLQKTTTIDPIQREKTQKKSKKTEKSGCLDLCLSLTSEAPTKPTMVYFLTVP